VNFYYDIPQYKSVGELVFRDEIAAQEEKNTNPERVPIGEITPASPGVRWGKEPFLGAPTAKKWGYQINPFDTYDVERNKGVSGKNARPIDVCLSKYSCATAEDMSTLGQCYTGVKRAMLDAGVLSSYDDMPRGEAHIATEYFDNNPDKFEKLDVKEHELSRLPAGRIIVYQKEGLPGHIAITNGKGQETSDCTDNMKWLQAKGEGATYSVYKLTDNWQYDEETKKLKFEEPNKNN
jgi:hypothetical protein